MSTPYAPSQHRLAHIRIEWLFLGIIALLAFVSLLGLYKSGVYEFVSGMVAGAWICILGGFVFYILRKTETEE